MPSFRDANGSERHLTITVGDLRRVKVRSGIDLLHLTQGGEMLQRFFVDPVMTLEIIEALLGSTGPDGQAQPPPSPQALTAMNDEQCQAARDALLEALIDFFHGPRRDMMIAVRLSVKQTIHQAFAGAAKKIASASPVLTESGTPSGEPPASSA